MKGISVVVPSILGGDSLAALVDQAMSETVAPVEVVIADNGLSGSSRKQIEARGAKVIEMGRNAGFGAAVNAAAGVAEGEHMIVTNDDVELLPGFVGALSAALEEGFEMAAGVLLIGSEPWLIDSAGIEIDRSLAGFDLLHRMPVESLDDAPVPLAPCGGAAAYSREAFLAAGGFDAGFFAYHEDLDLGLRLRASGARCALAPDARAIHEGSRTLGYGTLRKAEVVAYGRGYMMRRYGVMRRPRSAAAAVMGETLAVGALAVRHHSLRPAFSRFKGYRQGRRIHNPPPRELIAVGTLDGMRRRRARSGEPGRDPSRGLRRSRREPTARVGDGARASGRDRVPE